METYGCAANQGDASIMKGILLSQGHTLVERTDIADAIIIVTCTVIDTTQQRMMVRIHRLREFGRPLIVAGCMASAQPDIIRAVAPEAVLISPRNVHCIADALAKTFIPYDRPKVRIPRMHQLRMNIPIADGCSYNCSYCITKQARGALVSYPLEGIVEDIASAVSYGSREIRLTAQDTAAYGMDSGVSFADLIQRVADLPGDFRIRVGMMHPLSAQTMIDDLLHAYDHPKVYKFLHIPLQSASPCILKNMRRGYTLETVSDIVKAFRNRFCNLTFSTDIIVAFPGETKEDVAMNIDALSELQPDVTNITRFSPRPRTDAWLMKRVPTHVAKQRSKILAAKAGEISLKRNKVHIGNMYYSLAVGTYRSFSVCKTDFYKSVIVDRVSLGSFIPVRITDATPTHLHAIYLNGKFFT